MNDESSLDRVVERYLAEPEQALGDVEPRQRRAILEEIVAHIR